MNKRAILFVLLVSAAFLGLNLYFSNQRDAENRELLKQQEAKAQKLKQEQALKIEEKRVDISDLPVVQLYSDLESATPIGYGLNMEKGVITLAWSEKMPEKLFSKGEELILATEHPVREGAVLYTSKEFKKLIIASLPNIGSYDVQLITFPAEETPQTWLGEIKDGSLSIPQGPLFHNALVLYKSPQGWLPLGFYAYQGEVFVIIQNLPSFAAKTAKAQTPETALDKEPPRYYVLENSYQQLVFSNVGAALVEINLPFEGPEDKQSVVKEIGFDREIAKDYSANALFPAHPYYIPGATAPAEPTQVGGYYPLLRRGIWNHKTIEIPPQYYALNIVSDYPEMAQLLYTVKEFTKEKIVFEAIQPHRKITKTYTLARSAAPYCFDLKISIEGDSRGLWLSSGIPEVEIMSNSSSPQIQYRLQKKGKPVVEKLDLPKVKETLSISSLIPDWVVNSNGYLGVIVNPLTELGAGFRASAIPGSLVPTRLSVIDPKYQPYPASKYPGYEVLFPLSASGGIHELRIYAGPFDEAVLNAVDKIYTDPSTGYNPDYVASWTFYGWFSFISEPFAKLLFIVMKFFHSITHSWGLSIILLTVFLRLLLYPLNGWSFKSMRRMQQLSPQIQAIQAKHKKDPKKAQMEIMTLYREKKVNPFTGCLPILIQIPFLIAMFDLLKSSFSLRGASFIPGWIDNLTAPDVLFQWNVPIFFIGNQLHLLPIILGAVMFLQQKISSSTAASSAQMTDQQRQQKAMGTIMTVVFTVMFYHFPSGLNLYWLSSMVLGIIQQWLTNKWLDKKKIPTDSLVTGGQKNLATKKGK